MKIGNVRRPVCDAEVDISDAGHLAAVLEEYNEWRRGRGKYAFSENPDDETPFPFSQTTLGRTIDAAVDTLKGLGR